jgi:hypothetical protein
MHPILRMPWTSFCEVWMYFHSHTRSWHYVEEVCPSTSLFTRNTPLSSSYHLLQRLYLIPGWPSGWWQDEWWYCHISSRQYTLLCQTHPVGLPNVGCQMPEVIPAKHNQYAYPDILTHFSLLMELR